MSAEHGKVDFDELGPVIAIRVTGLLIVLFVLAAYLFDS
jgi:hypothetical protein